LELLVIQHADSFSKADVRMEHSRLTRRIDNLLRLEAGWDGQSALAPSHEALRQVAKAVESMPEDVLSNCAFFPSNDSKVYLQGKFPLGRLTAYFDGNVMTYVLKTNQGRMERKNVAVQDETLGQLTQSIKQYCME